MLVPTRQTDVQTTAHVIKLMQAVTNASVARLQYDNIPMEARKQSNGEAMRVKRRISVCRSFFLLVLVWS